MTTDLPDQTFDLRLLSGRVRARRLGRPDAPLVLLLHGLSAHLHSFDFLMEALANSDRQLVAVDLRGRGRSSITPPGTYGLSTHAQDVLEIASLLGAAQFDLIGWSMGALIAEHTAADMPVRLRRMVLIDHAGTMDPGPIEKITKGLTRLQQVVDHPDTYVNAIRNSGAIANWTPFWDNYYRYEMHEVAGGYQASTNYGACLEDLEDMMRVNFPMIWRRITTPTLLLRCEVPIGGGYIVPADQRDAIKLGIGTLQIEELPFDHYTVLLEQRTADLINTFLTSVDHARY